MEQDPVAEVRRRSGVAKRGDETLKEYVRRVGDEQGLGQDVVDGAVDFVTRWQYARTPPTEDDDFRMFLFQLGDEDSADATGETTVVETPEFERVPELRPLRAERRDTRSDFKGGLRGREPRTLLASFAVMVLTTPVVGLLAGRAWVPGHDVYDQLETLLGAALGLSGPAALELVGTFGLGLYASLLVLFVLDVKKRVQGMLLLLGSALALAALTVQGVFLPNLDASALNALGLLLGFAVGLLVEYEQLLAIDVGASTLRRPTLESGAVPEFRYAARLVFGLAAVVVAASLLQGITAGVVAVYDLPAAAALVYVTYRFVQYDSETEYVTLGPARAGKSMLTLGLCLELLAADAHHPSPNDYLQRMLEQVSNLQPGEERWPVPSTPPDELEVSSFEVIAGYYFPRRLRLTALDYAGQHLERVAGLLGDPSESRTDVAADGGRLAVDEDSTVDIDIEAGADSVPQRVAQWIRDSDTLVVLLDVERLVRPEAFQGPGVDDPESVSWGLEHYATILEARDPDDVVVVATKCDLLVDQGHVDPPATLSSFEEFRESVTETLSQRPDVNELLSLAEESTVQPVYFATRRRDGEYVPRLDESGNLMPVGFGHLLAEFRRRQ